MNKVFVFDIDGTLLNGNLHLTDCVLSAINHIKGKGCKITIATGRSALWSIPILDKLQIGIPYISSGGACIKDPVNNNIFFQNNIDKSLVYQLLNSTSKCNFEGQREVSCGKMNTSQTPHQ
ncbi:MAG: HAD-IIB family hydrolase, partial [Bacillota bacterium]